MLLKLQNKQQQKKKNYFHQRNTLSHAYGCHQEQAMHIPYIYTYSLLFPIELSLPQLSCVSQSSRSNILIYRVSSSILNRNPTISYCSPWFMAIRDGIKERKRERERERERETEFFFVLKAIIAVHCIQTCMGHKD